MLNFPTDRLYFTLWKGRSPYYKVSSIVGILALLSYFWYRNMKRRIVAEGSLSLVGFSRGTLERVRQMIEREVTFNEIRQQTLARDSDLNLANLAGSHVMLVAAFTERNNIMGVHPDYGELSKIYTDLPNDIKENVFVMYAGLPQYQFEGMQNKLLYPESFKRLVRFQPDLKPLMDKNRFLAITSNYRFNARQFGVFLKWFSKSE